MKLFNIPGPNGSTPIGLQTLTLMFEPLKDGLVVEHHNRLRTFCADWLKTHGESDADLPGLETKGDLRSAEHLSGRSPSRHQVRFR